MNKAKIGKALAAISLAVITAMTLGACGMGISGDDVIISEKEDEKIVNLFSPMEKTEPDAENTARNAFDQTIAIAEEYLKIGRAK